MIKLLSAILAHLPRLPGASCIGKHRMYDPVLGNGHQHRDQERARLAEAARVCAGCPVVQRFTTVMTAEVVIPAPRRRSVPLGVLAVT
jgi:hypothetical protein